MSTDLGISRLDPYSFAMPFSIPLPLLPEFPSLLVYSFWSLEWSPLFAVLPGSSSHSSSPGSSWQLRFSHLWFAIHGVPSPPLASASRPLPVFHQSYPLDGSLSLLRSPVSCLLHRHWSRGLSLTGYFFFDPLKRKRPDSFRSLSFSELSCLTVFYNV